MTQVGTRTIVHAPDSPMANVLQSLERIAERQATVLVTGESGAGKEAVVQRLHDLAPWSAGPFVPINCGAIPEPFARHDVQQFPFY